MILLEKNDGFLVAKDTNFFALMVFLISAQRPYIFYTKMISIYSKFLDRNIELERYKKMPHLALIVDAKDYITLQQKMV
jgi:hypothetical protein